jgi:hypothetical protein
LKRSNSIRMLSRRRSLAGSLAVACAAGLVAASPSALAGSGGVGSPAPPPPTVSGQKAKLVNGLAVAPKAAPKVVKDVIAAANKIAKGHGYCLGGGYAHWQSPCYDCSSSVSFALHGGGLINRPMSPSYLERWGRGQKGKWISVYANSGHAWMTIAGLRFDTADTKGEGPGWAKGLGWESTQRYTVRHKSGF